jgi:hypothetical protein
MARTYTYADVLNFVGANFNKVLTDAYGAMLCDQTASMVWNAADWRQSLGSLAPFYLSPLEQDYGAPLVQVPTDFLGLRTANLVYVPTQPPSREPLHVLRQLDKTDACGLPSAISYEPSVRKFRLDKLAPNGAAASAYMVEGTYKRTPTKVLATDLASSTLPFDDAYLRVFTSGLLYNYFAATSDPRAGQIQHARNGSSTCTGQLAVFLDALAEMAADEQLNLGDLTIAPAAPLVV